MTDKECWKECEYANPKLEIISAYLMKKQENEQLKQKISYLEDNLRVARKDRENLKDSIANGLKEFIKEKPFTSCRLLVNKEVKENIKNVRKKLFDILADYEIGNYDNNIHQFYKDVYDIHNELMELAE